MRKNIIRYAIVGWFASLSSAHADSSGAPLNYFLHAYGPAARPTMVLGWVLAAVCVSVCLLISGLMIGAIWRNRPPQATAAITRDGEGLRGVYIGTGISIAVLFALVVYALIALNDVATPSARPAFTITVTGYDWWWKAEYDGFETANEIHIPVGVPVLVDLKSMDVIHAFWVPQLAGKTQMIPGQTNRQWLQADTPGVYRGQCTQYCGVQHAHMSFEVVAESAEDFAKWESLQRQPALPPVTAKAQAGSRIFMNNCAACHTVRGTKALGDHAPDLTHLDSRRRIAAGLLTNTPDHRIDWVEHAQELKPGSRMPDFALKPEDASALSAYLATLR